MPSARYPENAHVRVGSNGLSGGTVVVLPGSVVDGAVVDGSVVDGSDGPEVVGPGTVVTMIGGSDVVVVADSLVVLAGGLVVVVVGVVSAGAGQAVRTTRAEQHAADSRGCTRRRLFFDRLLLSDIGRWTSWRDECRTSDVRLLVVDKRRTYARVHLAGSGEPRRLAVETSVPPRCHRICPSAPSRCPRTAIAGSDRRRREPQRAKSTAAAANTLLNPRRRNPTLCRPDRQRAHSCVRRRVPTVGLFAQALGAYLDWDGADSVPIESRTDTPWSAAELGFLDSPYRIRTRAATLRGSADLSEPCCQLARRGL